MPNVNEPPQSSFNAIYWVFLCWGIIQLSSMAYERARLVERWGISVGWLQLRCRTTLLNRWFLRLGLGLGRVLAPWFVLGSWFGIIAMVISPILLFTSALSSIASIISGITSVAGAAVASSATTPATTATMAVNATASVLQQDAAFHSNLFATGGGGGGGGISSGARPQLSPLIPGVSVPWSHTWYLVFALLLNGIFHELGHALAAVVEQVRIEACGGFLMAVYPGAFVELHSEQLEQLAPWGRLRIFAAGVWHNAVLAAIALILLNQMPLLLGSWYNYDAGAGVLEVAEESSLSGALSVGDVITGLDSRCNVHGAKTWYGCLSELKATLDGGHTGMCIAIATSTALWPYAAEEDTHLVQGFWECCLNASEEGGSRLCFEDLQQQQQDANHHTSEGGLSRQVNRQDLDNGNSTGNNHRNSKGRTLSRNFGCYGARDVASQAGKRCSTARECGAGMTCLKHTFDSAGSRLLQVQRGADEQSVLFLGSVEELAGSISVSDYSRRTDHPHTSMDVPMQVGQFLYYIASIGAALALLNSTPAFALDGEGAVCAVLDLILEEGTFRNAAKLMIGGAGVLLIGINMLLALIQLLLLQAG